MNKTIVDEVYRYFDLKEHEGKDKVTTLKKAISEHVKPGMNLYIATEAGAAMCELIRQFRGKKGNFIATMVGVIEHAINLVHCGLIRKLITTNCSHIYPSPGLSRIVQNAFKEKRIEIENWSLYTHLQRLMAGALGVGFVSTRSVVDSSMEQENCDSFLTLDDPFGVKGKVGLVRALNPDLAFVHGWAADRYGNTIGVAMSSQTSTDHNLWGAKASKNGVIVTVEKVVSTDFIRRHAALVTLPGYLVKSVCEVPFGAHPQGMISPIPGIFGSYAPDYEFVSEHRAASMDAKTMDGWIRKWVLNTQDHEEYIKKVGPKRITLLLKKAKEYYWETNFRSVIDRISSTEAPNSTEVMVLAGAKKAVEMVLKNESKILLGGMGAGMLASWCAYYFLKEKGYDVELVVGTGAFGFAPRPGDPFYGSFNNLHSCKAFFDTADIYGYLIAGENNRSLSILGAAEIDRYGNINTTKVMDTFLMGSGGANDAANASQVLVIARQSKRRFVDRVSYVTCPGRNVTTLVSDMGVFQKLEGEEEFTLVSCLPYPVGMALDERVRRIKENCGWKVRIADNITELPMPGEKELYLLRSFDPDRLILNS